MQFKNKTALVTGAASGIGRAVAERLSKEGARVVMGDLNAQGLDEVAAGMDGQAVTRLLDVSNPESCSALVDAAIAETGQLDILCNIAGVLRLAPLSAISPQDWARTIDVNLSGPFYMSQAAMPHLEKTKGCIVNLSSAAGLVGVPFNAPYVASKHGLVGLTRALALEFAAAGVRVNAVCPTGVKTPMLMTPPAEGVDYALVLKTAPWLNGGELCDPEDIADAVAFLASDEAKRVTGVAFSVDGGQTAI